MYNNKGMVMIISYNVCIKLFMGFPQAFVEAEWSK